MTKKNKTKTKKLVKQAAPDDEKSLLETIINTINPDMTVNQALVYKEFCREKGVSCFARKIYPVVRQGRLTLQVSIDYLREQAAKSGAYEGQLGPFWSNGEVGAEGGLSWLDFWTLKSPPALAKVGILRVGFKAPVWAQARYDAYMALDKSGKPTPIWAKMPENQLA